MATRILITLILVVLGVLSIKFTEPIARTFGQNELAERYLGGGGTYTMWKLIGIILIVVSFFVLTGDLDPTRTPLP